MKIHHLYEDENGQSHFKDIDVEFIGAPGTSRRSAPVPVKSVIFRETRADQDSDWHVAPRRQYVVNLTAGVQITASDGEARYIGPGEIVLLEDVKGKGHLSKNIENKLRHSLFITLE